MSFGRISVVTATFLGIGRTFLDFLDVLNERERRSVAPPRGAVVASHMVACQMSSPGKKGWGWGGIVCLGNLQKRHWFSCMY